MVVKKSMHAQEFYL